MQIITINITDNNGKFLTHFTSLTFNPFTVGLKTQISVRNYDKERWKGVEEMKSFWVIVEDIQLAVSKTYFKDDVIEEILYYMITVKPIKID